MNLAQQALARGAAVLAKSSPQGEDVTLNGQSLRVNVNRLGKANSNLPPGTKLPTTSIIQFPYPAVATSPEVGDDVTDSQGKYHRIETVKFLGHCWEAECAVS